MYIYTYILIHMKVLIMAWLWDDYEMIMGCFWDDYGMFVG